MTLIPVRSRILLKAFWHKARRPLLWTLAIAYFGFAGIFLTVRYAILPHISDYRVDIEQAISGAIKLPVSIQAIEADWYGLRPHLKLRGLSIADGAGRPALGFDSVDAILGWSSLLCFDVRLHRLEIDSPALSIRREANGQILVAGLPINMQGDDSRASDWILAQQQIVIRNAAISWDDAKRNAPTLTLSKVNFNLRNSGSRHRFALTAEPPAELAARLDFRGDFKGNDLDVLESWKGEAYAELDYADLAVWRTWVDYPIDLPRGSGGLRLWLGFAQKELTAVTADLALANVQLRLARDLPMLDLERLQGRFVARLGKKDYALEGKQLSLATRNGIVLPPLDFNAKLGLDDNGTPNRLQARFNQLDLGKLDALAAYLPLPPEHARLLAKLDLGGQLNDLTTSWDGTRKPANYSIKAGFKDVSVAPYEHIPGIRHLSGTIEGNELGGTISLASQQAALFLPAIFPEPEIALDSLNAKLRWQRDDQQYDVVIEDMRFANRDAEGNARGHYHGKIGTPGSIDLTAQLTRANGTAVWRYLPHAVNKDARDWVRQGIGSGTSNDVKLTLKGDLARFPFADGSGTFKVLVKAHNASINPAPGWPQIQNIDGDVAFIGVGMQINSTHGQILGANLSGVRAEIADLDSVTDQTLTITGKASGPTQEFLKFIEASPVGKRINHFTAGMQAVGNGDLDLKLKLTLHHIDHSTVEGHYRFDSNRLNIDPALPALTEVKGQLDFTGDGITIHEARANMLGAPVGINVTTAKDGQIDVTADGQFSVAALRKLYPLPLFDQLAGQGRWKGNVVIRKSDVDVRIGSDLVGLASSLPEPFNKSAATPLELRFERKPMPEPRSARTNRKTTDATPARREQTDIALGKLLRGQLVRAVGSSDIQRGYLNLGNVPDAARLPERGLTLNANLARIDVDFWRRMFNAPAGKGDGGSDTALPVTQLDLRTAELIVMNRTLQDVRLAAQQNGNNWKADFRSKGVSANLDWQPGSDGKPGRLSGRIPQLTIPDPNQQVGEIVNLGGDTVKQLPALALTIDHLNMRGHDWGTVSLDAENRNGYWNTRFNVNNEDGSLSGDGKWRPDANAQDTQLNFQLKAKSLEKLLTRGGYPDAIRRGTASIDGQLSWSGTPVSPDYPTLNGKLKVDLQNGQFKKLEPGFGRLLGILSLQSLPRRVTLDFRDIFSEGFAFDSIRGDMVVSKGIMNTEELTLNGPAAKVRMKGNVNLPAETQNLHVRVQPALGETLAVGAMLANPVAGAVAWLAQKVLRDPIDQAFAFEYAVTGSWTDPQVNKIETGRDINKEISSEVAKQNKDSKP